MSETDTRQRITTGLWSCWEFLELCSRTEERCCRCTSHRCLFFRSDERAGISSWILHNSDRGCVLGLSDLQGPPLGDTNRLLELKSARTWNGHTKMFSGTRCLSFVRCFFCALLGHLDCRGLYQILTGLIIKLLECKYSADSGKLKTLAGQQVIRRDYLARRRTQHHCRLGIQEATVRLLSETCKKECTRSIVSTGFIPHGLHSLCTNWAWHVPLVGVQHHFSPGHINQFSKFQKLRHSNLIPQLQTTSHQIMSSQPLFENKGVTLSDNQITCGSPAFRVRAHWKQAKFKWGV